MPNDRPFISDRAIQIVAEYRIRAAIAAGEFDDLPGFGKPSPLIEEAYDSNWWIRRKLRRENLSEVEMGARILGWTAGTTTDDLIEHYKRYIDRDKLRENLKLTVDERFKRHREKAWTAENQTTDA